MSTGNLTFLDNTGILDSFHDWWLPDPEIETIKNNNGKTYGFIEM